MKKLIVWFGCVMLAVVPALAQEQISRELPLQFANAVEVAAVFADKPLPKPPAGDFEGFIKRCLSTAFADFPANAWNWQTYLETQSETRPALDQPETRTGKLLPEGMAEPPVAVTERNALRVKGTSAGLAKLGEIIELLERPRQQVGLQVRLLGLTAKERDSLSIAKWESLPVADPKKNLTLRYAIGDFAELLRDQELSAALVSASICVHNNSQAQLRAGEVLPHYVKLRETGPATTRGTYRFLNLNVTPRVNADKLVTLSIDGEWSLGRTIEGDTSKPGDSVCQFPVHGEFRVADGQAVIVGLVAPWDSWESDYAGLEHDQFGPQRLIRPVVVITPRLLGTETPYRWDMGPFDPDLNERFLGPIFSRAIKDGADGIRLGMNDQGAAEVMFRTGADQWEPAVRMPSYVLQPLLHGLIDPAGEGNTYKREAGGLELDITVERTTIQGRPGVVLTWPRP